MISALSRQFASATKAIKLWLGASRTGNNDPALAGGAVVDFKTDWRDWLSGRDRCVPLALTGVGACLAFDESWDVSRRATTKAV